MEKVDEGKRLTKATVNRHKYSTMRRQLTMAASMSGESLRPWQKALALWLGQQVKRPKHADIAQQATALTKQPISEAKIKPLLMNPAFMAYVQQMAEEETSRAKAKMESRIGEAVDAHFDAIQALKADGDWKELAKFTNPILDRIWSTNEGPKLPAQIITINLGVGTFAQKNANITNAVQIEHVAEVIEETR